MAIATSTRNGWHAVTKAGTNVRIVTSSDGVHWDIVNGPSLPPAAELRTSGALAVREDVWALSTLSLSPPEPAPGLWVSTDGGRTWSAQTIAPPANGPLGRFMPFSWVVADLGFVGVGLIEDLTDNNNGYVLHSADGTNWRLDVISGCCRDITAGGPGLLGVGSGLYAWNPELPATGLAHVTPLVIAAVVLVIFGSGMVLVGHTHRSRSRPWAPGRV